MFLVRGIPSLRDGNPALETERNSIYLSIYNPRDMGSKGSKRSSIKLLSMSKWISKVVEVAVMHVVK